MVNGLRHCQGHSPSTRVRPNTEHHHSLRRVALSPHKFPVSDTRTTASCATTFLGLNGLEDELRSFETSATIYQSTRRDIPEDVKLQQCHCENLKISQKCRLFTSLAKHAVKELQVTSNRKTNTVTWRNGQTFRLVHFGAFVLFLNSVENAVFRLIIYLYEPCRRWYLLACERCHECWLRNDDSTERQRRFLSLYELHCFIRSVSNPEIAVCSSLFSNPCNNSLRYAGVRGLYQPHCEVFFIACCDIRECLTQNPSYISTGLHQRNIPCSHLVARLSNCVIPNIETQEAISFLHIRETRVHSSSQTPAVCTQDFVASLSPSR